ncbi:MAG: chemotaxis protein CheW [Treponema sp.]|nr:chemotaxis protein CheW [Treponema sp.]
MADDNTSLQLVTFQLGDELYGVDIMDVKEIVKIQNVRPIPNAPFYVEGIINLRSEVIPIINLHKRFYLKKLASTNPDFEEDDGGFIILDIEGNKIGIIIDRVARVVSVETDEIKPPPQMISGIGTEYIQGVVRQDGGYLIILDTRRMFSAKELQKILEPDAE